MVGQKYKENLFAEIFCIFECLLSQNLINQGSQLSWFFQTIWKTIKETQKQEALVHMNSI